jgi:hypothetical protein
MARKPQKVTATVRIEDADHHTYEMWSPGPDGKPMKMLEVRYSRKK